MCVCVCMCVYVWVCVYIYVCVCMCVHMYMCVYVCVCVCVCLCVCVCVCVHVLTLLLSCVLTGTLPSLGRSPTGITFGPRITPPSSPANVSSTTRRQRSTTGTTLTSTSWDMKTLTFFLKWVGGICVKEISVCL